MKLFTIMLINGLLALSFVSCNATKDLPGPEMEKEPTGEMGGGTGTGTIGDDPTNP